MTDCLDDYDCANMAAPAVCDPSAGQCKYICTKHSDCAGGLCSPGTTTSLAEVMICTAECSVHKACSDGWTCLSKLS